MSEVPLYLAACFAFRLNRARTSRLSKSGLGTLEQGSGDGGLISHKRGDKVVS